MFSGLIFVAKKPALRGHSRRPRRDGGCAALFTSGCFAMPSRHHRQDGGCAGLAADYNCTGMKTPPISETLPLLPAGRQIWKAVGVTSGEPCRPRLPGGSPLILDTKSAARGGTGQAFDQTLLAGLDKSKSDAGRGLSPDNALGPPGWAVWALISTPGWRVPGQEGCPQAGGRLWRPAPTVSAPLTHSTN